jgi:hypothetical protein
MASVRIIITAAAGQAMAALSAVGAALRRLGRMAASAGPALTKALPFALMAAKVTLLVGAVLTATGALSNLLGAVQLVAPAAAAGGLALLGLKLAMNGIQDALDAGLSGDTEKFEKALKKLAPQAADTVRALVDLRNKWRPLAKDFQGRVFEGAASELRSLSGFIKPIADRWLPRLALRFGEVRKSIADGIARYAADGRLEAVWRNIHIAVSSLLGAIEPLGRALGDILEVAAPGFAELGSNIESAARKFSDWVREMKENGSLARWLQQAKDAFAELKDIAGNLASILGAVFKTSGDEGQSFLEKLNRITEKMAEWANSEDGQSIIDMLASIVTTILAFEPAFKVVMGYIQAMSDLWGAMAEGAKMAWNGFVHFVIEALGRLLDAGVSAFGWLPGIGDKLKAAKASFDKFRQDVTSSLDAIPRNITVTVRVRQVGGVSVGGTNMGNVRGPGYSAYHSGGHPRGLSWVGEYGPELVDFGAQGRVFNNGQSNAMAADGGGVTSGVTVMVNIGPGNTDADRAMSAMVQTGFRRGWIQATAGGDRVRVA